MVDRVLVKDRSEAYWGNVYRAHGANLATRFGLDRVWESILAAQTTRPYGERRYRHAVELRMAMGE
jgi:hypothetical protein